MTLAEEIIRMAHATPELEQLRAGALAGKKEQLKKYVLFCVLQELRSSRRDLTPAQQNKLFRQFVKDDALEIEVVNG